MRIIYKTIRHTLRTQNKCLQQIFVENIKQIDEGEIISKYPVIYIYIYSSAFVQYKLLNILVKVTTTDKQSSSVY